jgi:hypothetical protein
MALSAAAEGQFVEFTHAHGIPGANGLFYLIEGFDPVKQQKCFLRVDDSFSSLIAPELQALEEDKPVRFFVNQDPMRNDPTQFRIDVPFYRKRQEEAAQVVPEPSDFDSDVDGSSISKSITATVPIKVWASLRAAHEKQKLRFPRFGDYVAVVLAHSSALLELGEASPF